MHECLMTTVFVPHINPGTFHLMSSLFLLRSAYIVAHIPLPFTGKTYLGNLVYPGITVVLS